MAHTCPWWLTYSFDNPLRRLVHDPQKMLSPWVQPGMRVADIGCGHGHFTLGLAALVGTDGNVQAVDLQDASLQRVRARLERQGLGARVTVVQATPERLGLEGPLDFVLTFWMVHEVADKERFFAELSERLTPDGRVLMAEPFLHVSAAGLEQSVAAARRSGLRPLPAPPAIRLSRSVLFGRAPG